MGQRTRLKVGGQKPPTKTKAKIGLGIITTGTRPQFYDVAKASVEKYVLDQLDWFDTYVDKDHKGVGVGKNWLLQQMLDAGCDFLFLMEDDIEIISSKALALYLAAYKLSGIPHLNFSQHGPNVTAQHYAPNGPTTFWPNGCGAFSFFTRECLEEHGLIDENFKNAYEHVEHSWRIYRGKLSYGMWPDATNSHLVLREQPGAIEQSTMGNPYSPERLKVINEAREYWFSKDPECPLSPGIM